MTLATAGLTKTGPLVGVKVLEFCHVMAGPTCGLMLADMGADVIKLENARGGDGTRHTLPPEINGEAAAFMMMNRNKRGIVVDLKTESGIAVAKRLIREVDIVTENYRPGTLERLGLDFETVRRDNPGLIWGTITGFGLTGPYASRGGFDLVAQGMSGLMSVTGEGPDRPPTKIGPPVCDITAGILLALGICAAYSHRLKTGQGQRVDTSLLEAGITHTYWQSAICFATGIAPRAMGSAHPLNAPYQAVRTADGHINIGAASQKFYLQLCDLIGAAELAQDPRFAKNAGRMANLPALIEELERRFVTRTSAEWLRALEDIGIPAGPIHDVKQMQEDPHTLARQMVTEVDHPVAGRVKTIGLPLKFSDTPGKVGGPAPLYGQHSREVLREFGFSDAEIQAFADQKAIILNEDLPQAAE